jgi:predicted unusual protein kinase regulating ubiquinone biosynthesis (AarF/ABC1/UbiB family)
MMSEQPSSKLGRLWVTGRTAAQIGGKVLGYYAKRPFLGSDPRRHAREKMAEDSAKTIFEGLSLLKGTALKMAQQLSLETDLLPEPVCRELSKAYHQVPPINRALVRQLIRKELGRPPETAFSHFDPTAFAAASLGQVHAAKNHDGTDLAVKIQYPGIAKTIDSDLGLLRQFLRPFLQKDQIPPIVEEMAARLKEEVDYTQEADHLAYFARNLKVPNVHIPSVHTDVSTPSILTTTRMPGFPLDAWLSNGPGQDAVDRVAQTLQDIFTTGLYHLNVIHADPNPGNFIIADDLSIGLVDFGCIKRLDPEFVEHYRRLSSATAHQKQGAHYDEMIALGLITEDLDDQIKNRIQDVSETISNWFGRLYADERFDFRANKTFITDGKTFMTAFHDLRKHVHVNPDFIFLDRTRYGLLRLYEQMGARVNFRNDYEWQDRY